MNKRRFIKLTISLAAIAFIGKLVADTKSEIQMMTYRIKKPDLKTIFPFWEGKPLGENGRFMNLEFPAKNKLSHAFKWMLQKNPQK